MAGLVAGPAKISRLEFSRRISVFGTRGWDSCTLPLHVVPKSFILRPGVATSILLELQCMLEL